VPSVLVASLIANQNANELLDIMQDPTSPLRFDYVENSQSDARAYRKFESHRSAASSGGQNGSFYVALYGKAKVCPATPIGTKKSIWLAMSTRRAQRPAQTVIDIRQDRSATAALFYGRH
jgi:hypothetical protein